MNWSLPRVFFALLTKMPTILPMKMKNETTFAWKLTWADKVTTLDSKHYRTAIIDLTASVLLDQRLVEKWSLDKGNEGCTSWDWKVFRETIITQVSFMFVLIGSESKRLAFCQWSNRKKTCKSSFSAARHWLNFLARERCINVKRYTSSLEGGNLV